MDLHHTFFDTSSIPAYVQTVDEDWEPMVATETIWYVEDRPSVKFPAVTTSEQSVAWDFYDYSGALAGLDRIRSFFSYIENWDGEGGLAPPRASVNTAIAIFSLVSNHRVPQVSMNSQGEPMMVFGGKHSGEIVVTGASQYSFYFSGPDELHGDEVFFDGSLDPLLMERLGAIA